MMKGAIPSTVPVGVLIFAFCQPLKDMDSPDLICSVYFDTVLGGIVNYRFWVAQKGYFDLLLSLLGRVAINSYSKVVLRLYCRGDVDL